MKVDILRICAVVAASLLPRAEAVIVFKDGATADDMVKMLAPALNRRNARLTGHSDCAKVFSYGDLAVRGQPFPDSGVVLSTGKARNLDGQTGRDTGVCFGRPGDSDLQSIAGFQTYDACVLEFEFSSDGSDLFFNYVFGSEEYPESVDSPINDRFALFLNGVNLARIPGSTTTSTTIGINNINRNTNPEYFNDNDPDEFGLSTTPYPNFQPDGFSVMLTAQGHTNASAWNRVKLVVADGGDCYLDSWVLLEKSSFTFKPPLCGATRTTPRLEPVSMGTQMGGTVIKIQSLPYCAAETNEVYCRFEGFATSMDEVVQGTRPALGTIECVTPYAGIASAVVVSFAFHDPVTGPFDKYQASWTSAHKEFMYFDGKPQVTVGAGAPVLNAETATTITWDNVALTQKASDSLGAPPVGLIATDLDFLIQVLAYDDNEAQAFQVIQNVSLGVTGGSSPLTIDNGTISSYTVDYGAGPMAIVMVRVVASYNSRIGAIASSGLIGVFPADFAPRCAPAPPAFCGGINALPDCPPTVSDVTADLDFFPDESCSLGKNGPGCTSFITDVDGCFRAYGPDLTGQRCCYSTNGALLPGRYIGAPGLEGPATADCIAAGRHVFANALHFAYDVVPQYLCCTFTTNCDKYYNNRPSADGILDNTYPRPTLPGWAFGDPHFQTLDGWRYNFNGAGEYVAFCGVKDAIVLQDVLDQCAPAADRLTGMRSAVSVHLRFGPVTTGTGTATVPVGLAIEDPQHQFGLRAISVVPHPTRRIDVLDGNALLEFQDGAVDAEGTNQVLYLSSGVKITRSRNFSILRAIAIVTIEMPSGLRLKILEKGGVMFPNLEVHPDFKNGKSVGLMGLVDGNPSNDFKSSDETETDPFASDEEIFRNFGTSWRIDNIRSSLFQGLSNTESFAKYHDPLYEPSFSEPTVSALLESNAVHACSLIKDSLMNLNCVFDIKVSGDVDLFRVSSQMAYEESLSLRVRTNSLPTITSTTHNVTFNTGQQGVIPFAVSDADTSLGLLNVTLRPDPKFNVTFNRNTGRGNITFAGSATPNFYATWLVVSDDFNSVLSTYVVQVVTPRSTFTPVPTCANNIKGCRCKPTNTRIFNCTKNQILTKHMCVPNPAQVSTYINQVYLNLLSKGKAGCH